MKITSFKLNIYFDKPQKIQPFVEKLQYTPRFLRVKTDLDYELLLDMRLHKYVWQKRKARFHNRSKYFEIEDLSLNSYISTKPYGIYRDAYMFINTNSLDT